MGLWVTAAAWWRRWAVREPAERTRAELVPAATFDPEPGTDESKPSPLAPVLSGSSASGSLTPRR
ncbi:hypothetical protein GZL_08418 [Streptomyces sp. 769]|nr:hypothetical protein GZL_08418 [Streptomyces sp. 769]